MKNKTILLSTLLIALFAITLLSGCKKEPKESCTDGVKNQNETGVDCGGSCGECGNGKVKSTTWGNYTDNYTYDGQGRVTLIQSFNNGINYHKTTWSYTSATAIQTFYDLTDSTSQSRTYNLNSQGLIYNERSWKYTYDSAGYRINVTDTTISNSYDYTWLNGNLVSEVNSSAATYTFTYLTDKTEYRDFGNTIYGNGNKNIPATQTINGTTITFTYEFDTQERITKETRSGSQIGEITYTYY